MVVELNLIWLINFRVPERANLKQYWVNSTIFFQAFLLLILAKYAKLEHDIKTQAWTQELVSSKTMLSKILLLLAEISYSKPFLESDAIYERPYME